MMQALYLQKITKKNADRDYEKTNPFSTQFRSPEMAREKKQDICSVLDYKYLQYFGKIFLILFDVCPWSGYIFVFRGSQN